MHTWLASIIVVHNIFLPPCTGAGIFVTTVVAGSVALVKPFAVASRPFLRDVIFYMVAVFWTFVILYRGTTSLGEILGINSHIHMEGQVHFSFSTGLCQKVLLTCSLTSLSHICELLCGCNGHSHFTLLAHEKTELHLCLKI